MSCPKCRSENEFSQLVELATIDANERSKSHRSWAQCRACETCFYGETTDYFDSDDFIYWLYEAEPEAWNESLQLALECPTPHNSQCRCPAHTTARRGIVKLWQSNSVYYSDY